MIQTSTNPFKAWLVEFLKLRDLPQPNKKPLYSYQVSEQEYNSLIALLKGNIRYAGSPIHVYHFSACFCLFVSEYYRRAYNNSWSWAGAKQVLNTEFTQGQHADFTAKGMHYWKRPIRQREVGRDWLGTLFMEGGLPWVLVQSETHGFGRSVRYGIKNYYRTENHRHTTADLMADFEDNLPQTFRNLETRQLLAGIVDQLMYLVDHYPIQAEADPAAYLDKNAPHWTADFPIPIDETNARHLINEWLRDAGKKRAERKEAVARAKAFTCQHVLNGDFPAWSIRTELILPPDAEFQIEVGLLTSTRFELAYYEGEKLLARGGVVYGQLKQLGDGPHQLFIRFNTAQIQLERREIGEPVSLHLLDNGRTIHRFQFEESSLEWEDGPLIFERTSDQWQLVGTASCRIFASIARIRLPKNGAIRSELTTVIDRGHDQTGGRWLETTADLQFHIAHECYVVELNRGQEDGNKPTLHGVVAPYVSYPSIVFCGYPRLDFPAEYFQDKNTLQEYVNGQPWQGPYRSNFVGVAQYSLRNSDNQTLLLRRFGVLPKDFKISLIPYRYTQLTPTPVTRAKFRQRS